MQEAAYISDKNDTSLSGKIRYYQNIVQANQRVQASLDMLHEKSWMDSLGEKDEVSKAAAITATSLSRAAKAISRDEIEEAQANKLLSKFEARELIQQKRELEMREIRESKTEAQQKRQHKY